jgi:hypothetical protein
MFPANQHISGSRLSNQRLLEWMASDIPMISLCCLRSSISIIAVDGLVDLDAEFFGEREYSLIGTSSVAIYLSLSAVFISKWESRKCKRRR